MKREQNNRDNVRFQHENSNHKEEIQKERLTQRMTKNEQETPTTKRIFNRDWQDENGY